MIILRPIESHESKEAKEQEVVSQLREKFEPTWTDDQNLNLMLYKTDETERWIHTDLDITKWEPATLSAREAAIVMAVKEPQYSYYIDIAPEVCGALAEQSRMRVLDFTVDKSKLHQTMQLLQDIAAVMVKA